MPICIEKVTFWKPLGPNGTVIIMVSGKTGREQNLSPPQTNMFFLTTWCHLVDFGYHFGAYWILNGGPQIDHFWKQSKTNDTKWGPRNVFLLFIDFRCQNRRPEIAKKRFPHYICMLQNMSFLGVVKHRENGYQKSSLKRSKSITLAASIGSASDRDFVAFL